MTRITHITDLETTTCYKCGTPFAFNSQYHHENHEQSFYCPNGHGQMFRDTFQTKLAREERRRREVEAERDQAIRQLSRLKRRVKNGVCPVCKRTFIQLKRHMSCKHPDFLEQ